MALIIKANTNAHIKNSVVCYPDGGPPQLPLVYDPICVAAFFEGVHEAQYAINRAIDRTLRAFTWADLQALLKAAGLLRVPRHLALLRDVVRLAQADWPQLLHTAPPAMQRTVLQRLQGATALGL